MDHKIGGNMIVRCFCKDPHFADMTGGSSVNGVALKAPRRLVSTG
uniref:Uncharacterized protein n=1 Tax=Aegilops tauschii subsp. strangulata TaxID=200361 RepID=A0A453K3G4_AEGTS